MPERNYKKDADLLRLIYQFPGAHGRQSLAAKLGIQASTLDKTLYLLYDALSSDVLPLDRKKYRLKLPTHQAENPFARLYALRDMKQTEIRRLLAVLLFLNEGPHTAQELNDKLAAMEETFGQPSYSDHLAKAPLKLLQQSGITDTLPGRPVRHRLTPTPLDQLSTNELADLLDYVSHRCATKPHSAFGHRLADNLRNRLRSRKDFDPRQLAGITHRYTFFSSVLAEHICTLLEEAISSRCHVWIDYPSRTASPMQKRPPDPFIPLRLLYDHSYGRWFLLAKGSHPNISVLRVENIQSIRLDKTTVPASYYQELQQAADQHLAHAWIVSGGTPVSVAVRFYFDPIDGSYNFIRHRVEKQGGHGCITEEGPGWFRFEITVSHLPDIIPWIRSFGSAAEVLSPPELREDMRQSWQEVLAIYE